jgi:AraC-like DNA-binding protein
VFDSSAVALGQRLAAWTSVTASVLIPLSIRSRTQTVDGTISEIRSGLIRVSRFSATAHYGERTEELINRGGELLCKVAIPLRGRVSLTQRGRTTSIRPGEVAVYSTGVPYLIGSDEPFDLAVALFPVDLMGVSEGWLLDHAVIPIDVKSASRVREELLHEDERGDHAERVMDRLRVGLSRARLPDGRPHAGSRLYTDAIDIIHARVTSAALTPEYLADAIGVSRRTLYSAFATNGVGVAAAIRKAKLNTARDLIRRDGDTPIREHAAELGFSDPAHFTRAFRREFGVNPSQLPR